MKNISLGKMLGTGFTLIIVIGFLVAILGRTQLEKLGGNIQILSQVRITNLLLMQEFKDNVNDTARAIRNIALLNDQQQMKTEKDRIEKSIVRNNELLAQIRNNAVSNETKALVAALEQSPPRLYQQHEKSH